MAPNTTAIHFAAPCRRPDGASSVAGSGASVMDWSGREVCSGIGALLLIVYTFVGRNLVSVRQNYLISDETQRRGWLQGR